MTLTRLNKSAAVIFIAEDGERLEASSFEEAAGIIREKIVRSPERNWRMEFGSKKGA